MVLVPGKEFIMSSLIPGNQKHLTLDNRVFIEKSLDLDMSLKDIAKPLCKDPSTISKEIKKHRTFHPHNDLGIKGPVNHCIHKKDNRTCEYAQKSCYPSFIKTFHCHIDNYGIYEYMTYLITPHLINH